MGLLLQKGLIGLEDLVRDRVLLCLRLRDLEIDRSKSSTVSRREELCHDVSLRDRLGRGDLLGKAFPTRIDHEEVAAAGDAVASLKFV